MLLWQASNRLILEHLEIMNNALTSRGWNNHIIHKPALSSRERISKLVNVFLFSLSYEREKGE